MGACASVTQALRGEKAAALAPEPAMEETTVVEETTTMEVAEKTVECSDEKVEVSDKDQSLGTLLVESEEPKEAVEKKADGSESTEIESSESKKIEAVPFSEPATTTEIVIPLAAPDVVPLEEKKTEVVEAEQK